MIKLALARRAVVIVVVSGLAISSSAWVVGAAPATAPARTPDQIFADMNAVGQDLQKVVADPQSLLDPKVRAESGQQVVPLLKKMLSLADEMGAVDPRARPQAIDARLQFLSMLSLLGDKESTAALDESTRSADPRISEAAKANQAVVGWWRAGADPAAQAKVLDMFQAMAKDNPRNANLVQSLVKIHQQTNSDDVKKRVREIIRTLKGDMADQAMEVIDADQKLRALENKPLVIEGMKADGKRFSSADWKGKVVLVDFWATWCGPCMEELPRVKEIYAKYHDKGLEIIGISCDRKEDDLKAFQTKNPDAPWPQLFDKGNPGWHRLATEYGVQGIPTMFLIDKKGICRTVDARENMEEMIPKLLAE